MFVCDTRKVIHNAQNVPLLAAVNALFANVDAVGWLHCANKSTKQDCNLSKVLFDRK